MGRPEPIYTYNNTSRSRQLSWTIILFGAEVAHAIQNIELHEQQKDVQKLSPHFKPVLTLYVLHVIIKRFKNELDGDNLSPDASRYGLALAYSSAGQFEAARSTLKPLLDKDPNRITYLIMSADIDIAAERFKPALELLETQLKLNPENYPLNIRYAEASMKAGLYKQSAELLERYSRKRKNDDYLWYLLAEVNGLNGDILGVHEARAEYFIANGIYDKAQIHLRNALKLSKGQYQRTVIMEERLKYVEHEMMEMRNQ